MPESPSAWWPVSSCTSGGSEGLCSLGAPVTSSRAHKRLCCDQKGWHLPAQFRGCGGEWVCTAPRPGLRVFLQAQTGSGCPAFLKGSIPSGLEPLGSSLAAHTSGRVGGDCSQAEPWRLPVWAGRPPAEPGPGAGVALPGSGHLLLRQPSPSPPGLGKGCPWCLRAGCSENIKNVQCSPAAPQRSPVGQ